MGNLYDEELLTMNDVDEIYLDLVNDVLENGQVKVGRNGVTTSVFGRQIRFNMGNGFPLLTTKKMFTKGVITELLWFLSGNTNIRSLVLSGNNIWLGDVYKNYKSNVKNPFTLYEFTEKIKYDESFSNSWGNLGPIYGKQWTNWGGINQIDNVVKSLNKNPNSRRIMVNAWNVSEIDEMVLPPCHYGFQLYTSKLTHKERCKLLSNKLGNDNLDYKSEVLDYNDIPNNKLSLLWNQRSIDVGLGLPFNIASYGFLLSMFAQQVNMVPHELIGSLGDVHIYEDHIDVLKEQLTRDVRKYDLPKLELNKSKSIFEYELDDFNIIDYDSYPKLKMPLSN